MGKIQILEDLADAIHDYPAEYLTIEVVQVGGFKTNMNEGEDVRFRIEVSNSGPLDVHNLTLLVAGAPHFQLPGAGAAAIPDLPRAAEVKAAAGDEYATSFVTPVGAFDTVPADSAGNGVTVVSSGDKYFFKPLVAGDEVALIQVSVDGWNTDFDHILGSLSDANPDAGGLPYSHEVLPAD